MHIGFTGTRRGMTGNQEEVFLGLMEQFMLGCFVHGDCVGADEDAHSIVKNLGTYKICLRPCDIDSQRAFCEGAFKIESTEPPLLRNKKIVDDVTLLIACPCGFKEQLRSGTWATIRYAKKIGRKVIIIWPDGCVDS